MFYEGVLKSKQCGCVWLALSPCKQNHISVWSYYHFAPAVSDAMKFSVHVWLCVALPAVEIVDIRQVSKEHISLVAKTCWQDRSNRRIVHFSPVALQNPDK